MLFSSLIFAPQYRVLPITKETLPEGFETLTDPQDPNASPDGWHSDGTTTTTTTSYAILPSLHETNPS